MPDSLVAGATWEWTQRLYVTITGEEFAPGGGASAKMHLNGRSSMEIAASDNGDGTWLFSKAPADTDAILYNGNYRWTIFGTLSSKVYECGTGIVEVAGFPDTNDASDNRTHAEKMLALIEAELQARVPGTGAAVDAFTIGTRQFQNVPLKDLEALRAKYAAEVAIQRYGKLPDVEAYFVRA